MSAIAFALALAATKAAPVEAEPLPKGAPTQPYPLAAWCYGALSEYLYIYQRVTPDLVAIDKMFGTSVPNEKAPYAHDMAAYRVELRKIGEAVRTAEQASDKPIAAQGSAAMRQGRAIWAPAEMQPERKLADAWLTWDLPDRCASNAEELTMKSRLLGQALKYNNPSALDSAASKPALAAEAASAPVTPPTTLPADISGASAPTSGDDAQPVLAQPAAPAADLPSGDLSSGDAPVPTSPDYVAPSGDSPVGAAPQEAAPASAAPAETTPPEETPAPSEETPPGA